MHPRTWAVCALDLQPRITHNEWRLPSSAAPRCWLWHRSRSVHRWSHSITCPSNSSPQQESVFSSPSSCSFSPSCKRVIRLIAQEDRTNSIVHLEVSSLVSSLVGLSARGHVCWIFWPLKALFWRATPGAATLLQSSTIAYDYGISGPYWYGMVIFVFIAIFVFWIEYPFLAAGATVQILLVCHSRSNS